MRLLFATRAMNQMAGGVERMIITIMSAMVARGHTVDLLTWDLDGAESFYSIPDQVCWHKLNIGHHVRKAGITHLIRRMAAVRRIVRQRRPEVIIGFQDGAFIALRAYTMGLGVPAIAAERNAPTRFNHTQPRLGPRAVYNSFRLAKAVIIQCESFRDQYPNYLHNKIITIPNPIFPAPTMATPDRPNSQGCFRLLSVGRLSYQKNFDCLISAFARLAPDFADWELTIIGEGEDRSRLQAKIEATNLADRISLPGNTSATERVYCSSHLFCLPSRWEGFPNALGEAMAHGLPTVGFRECAGVRDLVVPGETGLLATGTDDDASLAVTLAEAMSDACRRKKMGKAARAAIGAYEPGAIFDQWEEMFYRASIR